MITIRKAVASRVPPDQIRAGLIRAMLLEAIAS
jgi:hypothetical protein